MRIAIGGISHETNTFSTLRTGLDSFYIRRGPEVIQGEFWDQLRADGVECVPTLLAGATPNGLVELAAYETLKAELLARLAEALPVDGVYLSLHGAMEVEGLGDGETDLAGAVRSLVGPDVPISVSLDLHGNLSPEFVASANIFTALRTAPHVDYPETRERAVSHLLRCIRANVRPVTAMVKLPLLLPGENAVTGIEPSLSLYRELFEIEKRPGVWDASLMIACAWTDSPYTSVSTLVVADTYETALSEAQAYGERVWARRADFGPEVETIEVDDAIARAKAFAHGPVFLSDSGDNVTAGGAGDVPLFIERLLAAEMIQTLVAGITDPAAVAQCVEAGLEAEVELKLGGKLDQRNAEPIAVSAIVESLPEGMAIVRIAGLTVVVCATRRPFLSLSAFDATGLDPFAFHTVVLKQGYLAPDFRTKAVATFIALSPGFTDQRLNQLPYTRIRRPIYPLDPIE